MAYERNEPSGIRGWLILPLLGLIITPLRLSGFLVTTFLPIFQEGYWEVLTTPGSEAYHALWAPILIFEISGNVLFIIFAVALLILMLQKHQKFPKLMITYLALNLLFVVTDYFVGDLIPAVAAQPDPEAVGELVRAIAGAAIWIPYFVTSERVKNTFGKKVPAQPESEPPLRSNT